MLPKIENPVPVALFDSEKFAPIDRLPAFRDLTSDLYNIDSKGSSKDFKAYAKGYLVNELIFGTVSFSPTFFHRNNTHVQGDKQDFLVLELMLEGRQLVMMNNSHIHMNAGHIYLRDWAQEFEADAEHMKMHSIVIPRNRLKGSKYLTKKRPILSWSVSEASGLLISELWSKILTQFSSVSLSEAEKLTDALLVLIDHLLGYEATGKSSPVFDSMCQFILLRLHGEIAVSDICEHFNVSRSSVYREFEPHGGIKRYITKQRLSRCYTDLRLADPAQTKVSDIYLSWGFYEASSFTRAFKRLYQVRPSEILETKFNFNSRSNSEDKTLRTDSYDKYRNWFKEVIGNKSG